MIGEVISVGVHGVRISSSTGPLFVHRQAFGERDPAIGEQVEYRPFMTQDGSVIATNAKPVTAERAEVLRCLA
ncbi:hypothetical protein ASE61_07335 [Bosea sp. Root670]|uniref:hypothetical protein n=1 Tax=Bosea sp. Root670 TaxID=1736583 RepID=UPI000712985E|nr:hypothetical protein [Bosea sp. Root670]KRE04723.1 hypothetical protein ASE61_07335 [Bosea sp. Root670]